MPVRNSKLIILSLIASIVISFLSIAAYLYITTAIPKKVSIEQSNGFSKFIKSNVPVVESSSTDKVEWAKAMLLKFPYNKKLHAGILASKRSGEVWLVGKGGLDAGDPRAFLRIDIGGEAMRVKIIPEAWFTAEIDIDIDSGVEVDSNSAINLGDLLIIKATVEGENVIALTIRKLNIVNSL